MELLVVQMTKEPLFFSCSVIEMTVSIPVQGCIGCGKCVKKMKCIYEDEVNQAADFDFNAFVFVTDTYYGSLPKDAKSFLLRLFHSHPDKLAGKPFLLLVHRRKETEMNVNWLQKECQDLLMPFSIENATGKETGLQWLREEAAIQRDISYLQRKTDFIR
ncbi:MAG: flavodoxin family protein [Solobacterium sp.]|nr:flavodoxin family protein [Solobacterium sp.]